VQSPQFSRLCKQYFVAPMAILTLAGQRPCRIEGKTLGRLLLPPEEEPETSEVMGAYLRAGRGDPGSGADTGGDRERSGSTIESGQPFPYGANAAIGVAVAPQPTRGRMMSHGYTLRPTLS
jgi:hypothetical protein